MRRRFRSLRARPDRGHRPYWANTPLTAAGIEPLSVELQKEAEKTMGAAVDRVPASIPVTKILTEHLIRDALVCQIKSGKYDLVVMGSRGRGALSASLLGSVSHYALNHSAVPVLIVRAEEDEGAADDAVAAEALTTAGRRA